MSLLAMENVKIQLAPELAILIPNFNVSEGEIVSLVGRNGSGKTTALAAILGLVPVYSGTISFEGSGVAAAHPNVPINSALTVKSFLHSVRKFKQVNESEMQRLQQGASVGTIEKRRISKLSTGQHKKVELVAALASISTRGCLLVLDEPTNGLDEKAVEWIEEELRYQRERGVAIVICSHDEEFMQSLGARRIDILRKDSVE